MPAGGGSEQGAPSFASSDQEQEKFVTRPLVVGELKVQLTVITTSPLSKTPLPFASWNRRTVAEVKAISVIVSVHCGFGQLGAPGTGVAGGLVVVVIVTFPFLMAPAGIAVDPVTSTGAGF